MNKRSAVVKRTLVCLAASLMVCSSASAGSYTWSNGSGDRDFTTPENWMDAGGVAPGSLVTGDDLWVHEGGIIGSMDTISPSLTNDSVVVFNWLVVGFGSSLGNGRVDIDAGGTLRVSQVIMGWDASNPNNYTSIISLNATNSLLEAPVIQVGYGGIDAQLINNGGTISGTYLWVGGHPAAAAGTGSAQVDLLAGDIWLNAGNTDIFTIHTGKNVNIEDGRLLLLGDQTALVTDLLDGRLTGYGSSSNIQMDLETFPGWTTVTATPTPPLEIGDVTLDLLPGTNALTLTWATINAYNYAVESKIDLLDESWTTNTTGIVGTGGDITVTTAVDQAQSFYRVIGE